MHVSVLSERKETHSVDTFVPFFARIGYRLLYVFHMVGYLARGKYSNRGYILEGLGERVLVDAAGRGG
jgi:hypothetical protein